MWEYKATFDRVVDGDTIDFTVDLGFNVQTKIRTRLADVNTHETYGVSHDSEEFRLGTIEKEYVQDWFDDAEQIIIETEKTGKYGRWVAYVYNESGESLNVALIEKFDIGESY